MKTKHKNLQVYFIQADQGFLGPTWILVAKWIDHFGLYPVDVEDMVTFFEDGGIF